MFRSADYREREVFPNYEAYHGEKVFDDDFERAWLIEDWIAPESKIIDVGCGDGAVAAYLKSHLDLEVLAYDVSPLAVSKARNLGLDAQVRDIDEDPTFPSGFDYILLIEVIEHLVRPHVVLQEAAKAASKGVVVTIPNSGFLPYRIQALRGRFVDQSFTHLHFWTHKDFRCFCEFLGVQIHDFRPFSSGSSLRKGLLQAFPNILSCQLAYLVTKKVSESE